ncbi:hypothetical protein AVEN_173039-1 [Araneus ventricosus]|uniref:Uncharacterized protein n=1 Tax=Araneus ventricosus TaxID=182803 RepID=A0A4Y2K4T7_ARAVE|nr:hypothetical protein AVEN_173039-1 [Araneus ventricosus]
MRKRRNAVFTFMRRSSSSAVLPKSVIWFVKEFCLQPFSPELTNSRRNSDCCYRQTKKLLLLELQMGNVAFQAFDFGKTFDLKANNGNKIAKMGSMRCELKLNRQWNLILGV